MLVAPAAAAVQSEVHVDAAGVRHVNLGNAAASAILVHPRIAQTAALAVHQTPAVVAHSPPLVAATTHQFA